MAKIVYNACYGGFSLSEAGMRRYAEIKGLTLYPESSTKYPSLGIVTYWLVPEDERPADSEENWHQMSLDECAASNAAYRAATISARDFERHDLALVQVVEELGEAASGEHAELKITEVPSGTSYRIDEYDGCESVMTADDYAWTVAP